MIQLNFSQSKEIIFSQFEETNSEWKEDIRDFLYEWWNDKDYITSKTSGSTGTPKIITLSKKHVENSAKTTGNYFNLQKGDNALLCMSPNFIAGKLMIVRAIISEMNLICIKPSSFPLQDISNSIHIDFAAMIPLQVSNSIDKLNKKYIDKLIIGGGSIDDSLLKEIRKSNTEIYATYGMTETITHVALKRLNGNNPDNAFSALDDIYFSIDKRNCLVIDAKNVSDEIVRTNDIVELINNKYFEWIGRYDNVINTGGIKVSPEKIEKALSDYIRSPFFISSVKDKKFGEQIILLIEGNDLNINIEEIKKMLPKYHSPKKIFYIDEFSRTPTGKIKRNSTLDKAIKKYEY